MTIIVQNYALHAGKKFSVQMHHQDIRSMIIDHINNDYDINNEQFLTGICRTCCQTLKEAKQGRFDRPMPKMPRYQDIILPANTRSRQGTCDCFVCLIGRDTRHMKVVKGRGHKRIFDIVIDSEKGKRATSNISSLPKINPVKVNNTSKICNKCKAEIHRG